MNKALVILAAVVISTVAVGPTRPYGGFRPDDCESEQMLVVDEENMCWYHQCMALGNGEYRFLPRRCALGSSISYNYVSGESNPCTINQIGSDMYTCDRTSTSIDGEPSCFTNPTFSCENGGALVYESTKCWCQCPESWRGDFDCSKPTRSPEGLPEFSDICVNGEPLEDWCRQPNGGCLNGGICYNQCNTFWCDCPDHENNDYKGKRCEL